MLLYDESDAPRLKEWIVQRLGDTSDADSDILADYVLALLRHEGDITSTRELCESELKDFFQEGTNDAAKFVDELFRVLDYKSYLPGALPPPTTINDSADQFPAGVPTEPRNHNKRKAADAGFDSIRDTGASKASRTGMDNDFANPRAVAQPWAGGYPGTMAMLPPRPTNTANLNTGDSANMNMGIDLNALANMALFNQNLLAMFTGVGPLGKGPDDGAGTLGKKSKKKKRRCRDWERTGACPKGEACKFLHSAPDLPFPMPDMSALMNLSANLPALFEANRNLDLNLKGQAAAANGKQNNSNRVYDIEPGRVYVRDIPAENFSEDAIRDFFTQFGSITDIVLQQRNTSALIQFAEESEALAAIDSPKPVFDNRFVTVVPARKLRKPDEPVEPEFNMEEVIKKQEEAQRTFEEKKKLRDELQQKLKDLEQQETTIRKSQFELKRKIAEKQTALTRKNGGSLGTEADSDMEILRAQLAALEDEALSLGLTPANGTEHGGKGDDNMSYEYTSCPSNGGLGGPGYPWRGRGRGGRARGAVRGRFRGDIHQAYRGATLDNRPRTVAVKGVDFTISAHSEALRQYLMAVGSFTDIQSTSETTHIMFDDRKTAETFWNGLAYNPITGVAGELELSWVSNTAGPLVMDVSSDGDEDENVASAEGQNNSSHMLGKKYEDDDRADVDYDVADEDDWNPVR
ncbi:hypothetical protein BROUX41_005960 [Berkeleyomyces rouxiae]|uniref:uncharacterized protein n=1 Tax=Berkeleyomyces rouxiae TaxID=2035830 RepID=UPI003B763B05